MKKSIEQIAMIYFERAQAELEDAIRDSFESTCKIETELVRETGYGHCDFDWQPDESHDADFCYGCRERRACPQCQADQTRLADLINSIVVLQWRK